MRESSVDVHEEDNGQSFQLAVGAELRVTLNENPTTGFRWRIQKSGGPVIRPIGDRFEARASLPGGSGVHTWCYEAVAGGQTTIEMTYARAWAPNAVAQRFEIRVTVIG
jgi:inhibitor of cysteine peptidase